MNKLDEMNALGFDSNKLAEIDWKVFYTKSILPAYRHQPNIARAIFGTPAPLNWDGKKMLEIPKINDISDPIYALEAQYTNDEIDGDTVKVELPQISKSMKLTHEQRAQTLAGLDRLKLWSNQVMKKFVEFENKIAFQGDSKTDVKGALSTDAHDLGDPTDVWGAQDANGKLTNAIADFLRVRNRFSDLGFGERPLKFAITSPISNLLKGTLLNNNGVVTNFDAIMKLLPPGSQIFVSNNIQDSVSSSSNSMVAFVQTTSEEEIGYKLFSTGIRQQVQPYLWGIEYGVQEKFTVKIADDDYVCWMDGISTAAS